MAKPRPKRSEALHTTHRSDAASEISPDVGKYSGRWSRLCRHKRAPPIAMIAGQSRPSQGAYQGAPMRSMPRCGTVQAPPRAAVPPARGGIGPGQQAAGVGRLARHPRPGTSAQHGLLHGFLPRRRRRRDMAGLAPLELIDRSPPG